MFPSAHLRFAAPVIAAALLIGAAGFASVPRSEDLPRTFTVSGQGEARQAPDLATVSAGVRTEGQTAEEALRANNQRMAEVFKAVKAAGIEDKDIQTSNFSVQPIYQSYRPDEPQPSGPPKVVGYQVFNQVTLIVRDLTKLGTALDSFITVGANELYGIGFGITETKPLENAALKAAIEDATEKARLMAEAAGVSLGRLVTMSESGAMPPQPVARARAEMSAADSVPVAAGEQAILATVSLTFEIR